MGEPGTGVGAAQGVAARPAPSLRFEIRTDRAGVAELFPAWDELLERSICNRAFSSPVWFETAIEVNPELRPCLLAGWRDGVLAALAPLAIAEGGTAIFPSSMSNYNDVIVARGDREAAAAAMAFASEPAKPYDRLEMLWLREDSNAVCGVTEGWQHERTYNYIALDGGVEPYLRAQGRSFRKGVKRAVTKAEAGGLDVRQLHPAAFEPARLPGLFLRLHLERFGERSAFRTGSPNRCFAEIALPQLFRRGGLVVFVLEQEGEIVGIDLSMSGERSLCTWNGGYPPHADVWSPGRLLIWAGIRTACELGFEEYDLLRGEQEWKMHWANRQRRVGRIARVL